MTATAAGASASGSAVGGSAGATAESADGSAAGRVSGASGGSAGGGGSGASAGGAPGGPTEDDRGRGRFDRRLIAPMVLGSILNPVNSSIIAVSLVPIGVAFGAPASQTAWLVSALYLATAIGQPVVGRLVDLFGPRRLLLAGAVLTAVAGVVGTLAPNLAVLVVARVILGFGTCAGYPASMYLIRSEAQRTGLASPSGVLTVLAVAGQTTVVVGPPLGGLLIGLGGWRTTFAVNIPLAVATFVVGLLFLPTTRRDRGAGRAAQLDLPGIALFAATLVTLLLFLMHPDPGHTPLLAAAVACAAGLVWRERRTPSPFLDLRLLAGNRPLLATYLRTLLALTISYAFLYGFTQWMEDSRGLHPAQAGLVLVPMSVAGIAVSATTGRRPRIRGKLVVAAVSQLAGCGVLLALDGHSPIGLLLVAAVLLGAPQGLGNLANQNAVYHQADPVRLGSSSGLLRTFVYLGAMVAAALNGALFGTTADTRGLHRIAGVLVVVAVLLLALTLVDRSLGRVGAPSPPSPTVG